MKILITGSSGFVGTYLTKKLSRNHQIVRYDLVRGEDILDHKLLEKKLKGVDLVIHLAAFISAQESWTKPMKYLKNNSLGTMSVVKCSIRSGVKRLIFFSSAAVKAKPLTPYAISKISAEEVVKLYANKINSIIVRPENIYGLGQKANYGYVIHNFIKSVKSGKAINIYGTGKQSRDFIYIDDVVLTIESLLKKNVPSGSIINLGTGKETRIIDLAKLVMRILKKTVDISFLEKRDEPSISVADCHSLLNLKIDYKKFKDLSRGITKLI